MGKFSTFCHKYDIPIPDLPARELEHMNECKMCIELWPRQYFIECFQNKLPFHMFTLKWIEITEKERLKQLKVAYKLEKKWLKDLFKQRKLSPYHLFLKDKHPTITHLCTFKEKSKYLSDQWKDPSIQNAYKYLCTTEKQNFIHLIKTLPTFQLKLYKQYRRSKLDKAPKKQPSSFVQHLSNTFKKSGLSYKEHMKKETILWNEKKHLSNERCSNNE